MDACTHALPFGSSRPRSDRLISLISRSLPRGAAWWLEMESAACVQRWLYVSVNIVRCSDTAHAGSATCTLLHVCMHCVYLHGAVNTQGFFCVEALLLLLLFCSLFFACHIYIFILSFKLRRLRQTENIRKII